MGYNPDKFSNQWGAICVGTVTPISIGYLVDGPNPGEDRAVGADVSATINFLPFRGPGKNVVHDRRSAYYTQPGFPLGGRKFPENLNPIRFTPPSPGEIDINASIIERKLNIKVDYKDRIPIIHCPPTP